MPPEKRTSRVASGPSSAPAAKRQRPEETSESSQHTAEATAQTVNVSTPIPPEAPPSAAALAIPESVKTKIKKLIRIHPEDNPHLPPKKRFQNYVDIRHDFFQEWRDLENQMSAGFVYCQSLTKNWTTKDTYRDSKPPQCKCSAEDYQPRRNIDLIDMINRKRVFPIRFCSCQPEAVQLLHQGYIASSPSKPCRAFSVKLIQFYHSTWRTSGASKSSFLEGIMAFHLRGNAHQDSRALIVPFFNTFDLYIRILYLQNSLFSQGMLYKKVDLWAEKCARCFGPAEGENPTDKELFSVFSMDANFRQQHLTRASIDKPLDDHYPEIFVKPSEIEKLKVTGQSTDDADTEVERNCCSKPYQSSNMNLNTAVVEEWDAWEHFDDTGIFAACCRHDVPLQVVNIHKTHEKPDYPLTLIQSIIKDFPGKRFGVIIPSGCNLERYLRDCNLLPEERERLQIGTPVLDAYGHEWQCQLRNNPVYNEHWGLSNGEGLEHLSTFLALLVSPLQTATRTHRLSAISDRLVYYTELLQKNSAKWILQQLKQTISKLKHSETYLNNLYSRPNPQRPGVNYKKAYLEAQWKYEREFTNDTRVKEQTRRSELGKLLCLQDDLDLAWKNLIDPTEKKLDHTDDITYLREEIETQRKKIDMKSEAVTSDLADRHLCLLLKVWYSKTEVRRLFLEIKDQKRPLELVSQFGMETQLDTSDQDEILRVITNRAAELRPALDTYNRHLKALKDAFPTRLAPDPIDFKQLMTKQPDDLFWYDGVFTREKQEWAFHKPTQSGMRALAHSQRANEEIRRLRWETRRLMRWATDRFQRFGDLILLLGQSENFEPTSVTQAQLKSFMDNEILACLSLEDRMTVVKTLVHNKFIGLCKLYGTWNEPLLEAIRMSSSAQPGDETLISKWNHQMAQLGYIQKSQESSTLEGDIEGVLLKALKFDKNNPQSMDDDLNALGDNSKVGDGVETGSGEDEDGDGDEDEDLGAMFERQLRLDEIEAVLQEC